MKDNKESLDNIFIVKPVASSQGKGIYLTNKIQEVSKSLLTLTLLIISY